MTTDERSSKLTLSWEELLGPKAANEFREADRTLTRLLVQAREFETPIPTDPEIYDAVHNAFPNYRAQRKALETLGLIITSKTVGRLGLENNLPKVKNSDKRLS